MRTLIVDDHALFSAGLRLLLAGDDLPLDDFVRCETGQQALDHASLETFDIVLLDWRLGGGLSGAPLIEALKAALPAAPIVVISGECTPLTVREAIDAGASGFVPKESTPELMIDALNVACHGGVYLPMSALQAGAGAATVPAGAPRGNLTQSIWDAFPDLTPREAEVLSLVVRGMPNKKIALTLDIAGGTVKVHLSRAFRELGVDNRTEAVYELARRGVRLC